MNYDRSGNSVKPESRGVATHWGERQTLPKYVFQQSNCVIDINREVSVEVTYLEYLRGWTTLKHVGNQEDDVIYVNGSGTVSIALHERQEYVSIDLLK